MSGLAGGGAVLIRLEDEGRAEYLDFYAAKPAAVYRGLPGADSTAPLREMAVPGTLAGLLSAHERFGSLPRREVSWVRARRFVSPSRRPRSGGSPGKGARSSTAVPSPATSSG